MISLARVNFFSNFFNCKFLVCDPKQVSLFETQLGLGIVEMGAKKIQLSASKNWDDKNLDSMLMRLSQA